MMKKTGITREQIIDACVRSMVRFGYEHVNKEIIFSGNLERMFFKRLLEQAKGENKQADIVLDSLLAELDAKPIKPTKKLETRKQKR